MNEFYAYGEDSVGLEAAMRLHAVKRWHMIDTTRQQTLAEHSANVALLAYYIAVTSPEMFFGPAQGISAYALVHDLAEVFTGDVPSHSKRYLTGVGELEERVLPRMFQIEHTRNTRLMVKLCDLADGIRFVRLCGVDGTARHAKEGLEKQLADRKQDAVAMEWPDHVLEHVWQAINFYAYELS